MRVIHWNFINILNNTSIRSLFHFFLFLEGSSVIPPRQAGLEIFNCNDDFISVNSIRFCGEKLNDASRIYDLGSNAPVTDVSNGPIVLPVRTNDAYVGRGFKLQYRQISCQEDSAELEVDEQDTVIITWTRVFYLFIYLCLMKYLLYNYIPYPYLYLFINKIMFSCIQNVSVFDFCLIWLSFIREESLKWYLVNPLRSRPYR